MIYLFVYHRWQDDKTVNHRTAEIESDGTIDRNGSVATIHYSQKPTFTTGVFVSESMAWVESELVAGIRKIGLFSVAKFSGVPAYNPY